MGFLTRILRMTHPHRVVYRAVTGVTIVLMTLVLVALLGITIWCIAPLPVAVVVGRAFRAGDEEESPAEIVRGYDAAGV